jgi:sugar phosphate isomerase/epimerase
VLTTIGLNNRGNRWFLFASRLLHGLKTRVTFMNARPLDLSRCAIHTQTTKPWSLAQCIEGYGRAGIRGISVWRDVIEPVGAEQAGKMLRDAGMQVPALVRGGFFVAQDAMARRSAIDVNLRRIDEASAIGAQMVVLVCGAAPGVALPEARKHVTEGIAAVLPRARSAGVKLAIEPLHPMYAADRSCINRMAEARLVCEQLADPMLGIAVDVYHVWWDPDLQNEIELAGRQKTLFAFHVCDWRVPTRDLLTDRGLMGEGCIDIRTIRSWVDKTGFDGPIEIEVFSQDYWSMDQNEYVARIAEAFLSHS